MMKTNELIIKYLCMWVGVCLCFHVLPTCICQCMYVFSWVCVDVFWRKSTVTRLIASFSLSFDSTVFERNSDFSLLLTVCAACVALGCDRISQSPVVITASNQDRVSEERGRHLLHNFHLIALWIHMAALHGITRLTSRHVQLLSEAVHSFTLSVMPSWMK